MLRSVSRTLPGCLSGCENELRIAARRALSLFEDMEELVRLGAYKPGSSVEVDRAVLLAPAIEALLGQARDDRGDPQSAFDRLSEILSCP